LAGTVIKGTIKIGQILHLGPDIKGNFRAIEIYSIECMRISVKLAKCGQVCTVGIKLLSYAKEWLDK
jgi:GTPase